MLLASGSDGAGSREGSEERRACRAYDRNFEVIQRQTIPGGGLEMLASASQHRICAERGVCLRDRSFSLGTWVTMIDECANGHQLRELRDPTIVIRVEMCDEQVVDLLNSRIVRGGHDPVRITRLMRITWSEA